MIFETLYGSAERGELILVDDGYCRFHLCSRGDKAGQLTIYEIIVLPGRQGQGIGNRMLKQLKLVDGAKSIFARCPTDLPANDWYKGQGFDLVGQMTSGKRTLNEWRLSL